jgi:hypothetical protein
MSLPLARPIYAPIQPNEDLKLDSAWTDTYLELCRNNMNVSLLASSPESAFRKAAFGLSGFGCQRIQENMDECLQWAKTRYPDHYVPVATCRLWTAANFNSSNQSLSMGVAPHEAIANALNRRNRLTPDGLDKIKPCMPYICFLGWALTNLPSTPEFDCQPDHTVYRRVNWVFPNPAAYNPEQRYKVGSVVTWYGFRSASETVTIASNKGFVTSSWIYENGPNSWLFAEGLVGTDGITSLHIAPPIGLIFQGGGKQWSVVDYSGKCDLRIKDVSNNQRFHVLCTQNLATIFEITTTSKKAKKIRSVSHFPNEGEVLFPPLSQFKVTKVNRFFPQYPDHIYLEHVNTIEAAVAPAP